MNFSDWVRFFWMGYRRRYLSALLLLGPHALMAQSAMFSQYYFSPMNINPALLGTQSHLMAGIQHRSQWRNLDSPYRANTLSVVNPITLPQAIHQTGGIGLSLVDESVGTHRMYGSLSVQLGAAYNIGLDRKQHQLLSFGLQGGFTQRKVDHTQLQWGSQYDPMIGYNPEIAPSVGLPNDQISFASFGAGLVYYYNPARELLLYQVSGFSGFSVTNLNRPNSSFYEADETREALTLRWHSGLEIPLSTSIKLLPQLLVAYRDAQQYHINVGTYLHYAVTQSKADEQSLRLLTGAWYRWNDSWVTSAGMSYQNYLLAISYDFNTQPVAVHAFAGGAFEVSLAYRWLRKKDSLRKFSTPMI